MVNGHVFTCHTIIKVNRSSVCHATLSIVTVSRGMKQLYALEPFVALMLLCAELPPGKKHPKYITIPIPTKLWDMVIFSVNGATQLVEVT